MDFKQKLFFFLLLLVTGHAKAQEANDCVNAIVVCGNSSFSSNVQGPGMQEVSGCQSQEHNSIWLEIHIEQSGTLGFDLIPDNTDLSVDYDFWVFGPNVNCTNLSNPIRCSTTNPIAANLFNNHTGLNGMATGATQGPGPNGDGYLEWLTVTQGESYFVVIDRPVGFGGFSINWTGSATQNDGAFPEPPQANAIDDLQKCSENGSAVFNLGDLRNQINPDQTDNNITFHESLADAVDGINPLPDNYQSNNQTQTIHAKVVNQTTQCSNLTEFNLQLVGIQEVDFTVSNTSLCTPREVNFSLQANPGAIISYTINGANTQTIQLNDQGAATFTAMITEATQIDLTKIEVFDTDGTLLCNKALTQSENIGFNGIEIGENLLDFMKCDGDKNNRVHYDLSPNISLAKANVNSTAYQVDFYESESDALNRLNPIANNENFEATSFPKTIWVRLEETAFPDCYDLSSFQLDRYTDAPPSYKIAQSNTDIGEEHQVSIYDVSGVGPYEFKVGQSEWKTYNGQTELSFTISGGGEHSVIGRHVEGCGQRLKTVVFLDYPKFFTPNNDGINDYWNVKGASSVETISIHVFNRYGKRLTSVNPNQPGWNGTYNGKPVPAGDYWFLVTYEQINQNGEISQKEFKANFSLIR